MKKQSDRYKAFQLLFPLFSSKVSLMQSMQTVPDLTPFAKAIAFGVARHSIRLSLIASQFVKKKPKSMAVWVVLLIGLYQRYGLNQPDYAIVKETVGLLNDIGQSFAKGFVNAVLRQFCRDYDNTLKALEDNPAFVHNHPEWFIEQIQVDWPMDWASILRQNDEHPPLSLRVNALRQTRDAYLQRLDEAGIAAKPHQYAPMGIQVEIPCDVFELPGFEVGDVSVQDEAAQLAVGLLDLHSGLTVLDPCCAPGGKTAHILETMPTLSRLLAIDIDASRLSRVRDNLSRLQLTADIKEGDAQDPQSFASGQTFDRILLDAPCSATGVIRRHPDIKLLRDRSQIEAVADLQHNLLKALWPYLAPGGRMVYATCSVLKQENDAQIQQFLSTQSDATSLPIDAAWGVKTTFGRQLLPGETDGFYYALLLKGC